MKLIALALALHAAHTSFVVCVTVLPRPVITYSVANGIVWKSIDY